MRFSPLRSLVAGLAVVSALAFLVSAADARVGGGSSAGSRGSRTFSAPAPTRTAPSAAPIERSMTQPGVPARPSAGTQGVGGGFFNRPGGLFGGGLLGGLAAGFLGAGLFGLLFGHGLFGGMGGFASFLGLILQIGLVAFVAMLAWRWWQRRNQPAYASAGASSFRDMGFNRSALGGAMGGGGAAQPVMSEAIEIGPADYDAFERLLSEIQAAYGAEDLNALRSRATPEMVSYFADQLADNASRGVINKVSDVKLLQGDLAEAWREDGAEYATVAMRFALIDKTIDRASGRVVDGSDAAQEATELWTFRRGRGGNWLLSAIQQAR
jgi:predicted lipid-binding transport protein (Tim44 family)